MIRRALVALGLAAACLVPAAPSFAASPLAGKIITIDPGHGGRDPGAVANGFQEKDITLAIATDLGAVLQAQGARAIMTRTSDVALGSTTDDDLQARVNVAQRAHANAFVSIHANWDADPGVAGFTDFYGPVCGYYSGASMSAVDVGRSYAMADDVRHAVEAQTGEADHGSIDTAFWVLGNPGIPAILAETGFISNSAEANKLATPSYQQAMARGIAQGLTDYFGSSAVANPPTAPADALASCSGSTAPASDTKPATKPDVWVQTFLSTPLMSGADPHSMQFTVLDPFSYLKVMGAKGNYLYVLNPQTNGPGYVEAAKVGPSGPPPPAAPAAPAFTPFWVQTFVPANAWSGSDAKAMAFGPLPVWSYLQVLAPPSGPRFQVKVASTGGAAYVDQAAVGPSGPPPGNSAVAAVAAAAPPATSNTPVPAAPVPAPVAQPATQKLTVQPHETLTAIARQVGATVAQLVAINRLANPDDIQAGQVLLVPAS